MYTPEYKGLPGLKHTADGGEVEIGKYSAVDGFDWRDLEHRIYILPYIRSCLTSFLITIVLNSRIQNAKSTHFSKYMINIAFSVSTHLLLNSSCNIQSSTVLM